MSASPSPMQEKSAPFKIAIIGAGFAGICMGIRLKQAGIDDFVIYERADELGGTWRDNTYPGCACDVPSHLYSFSFDLKKDWPRVYSSWEEIQDYLHLCAEKYGLTSHIKYGVTINNSRFDEDSGLWTLTAEAGDSYTANVIASGTGPLNKPFIPDIPGLNRYKGKTFHSSQWDHDFDCEGKTIAAIGNGCSGIQYIPEIAPKVSRLHVFTRTPTWIVPRFDRAYAKVERWAFKWIPGWPRLYRYYIYWRNEYYGLGIIGYPFFNKLLQKLAHLNLNARVKDPVLREKLTPTFRIGCKRINISDDYYQTLQRDNVELVTEGIQAVTENGLITADGKERAVDAIIFGTGFVTTEYLQPMKIYGRGGKELTEQWQAGAESYLGISVAGFPNYFLLLGPNTGLGHNSVIFMIEAQVDYVMNAIEKLRAGVADAVDVRADVQRAFSEKIQEELKSTSWASGCQSWYLAPDGRNFSIWPGFTMSYWFKTRRFEPRNYELLTCKPKESPGQAERVAA